VGGGKNVDGDVEQRLGSHLLLSTVKQVAMTILDQRAVSLPGQGVCTLEELLKHTRTPQTGTEKETTSTLTKGLM